MIEFTDAPQDETPRETTPPFTEEEHLLAAQLYLEHLYTQAFNEASLYAEAFRAVRRVGILAHTRDKEIRELERWYALDDANGRQPATDRPEPDAGAGG